MSLQPGYYSVTDPEHPGQTTTWRIHPDGHRTPWPANHKPGPRLFRCDVPTDPDQRDAAIKAFNTRLTAWLQAVADALRADPEAAAMRFSLTTLRCSRCARPLTDDTSKRLGIGPDCRAIT